MPRRLLLALALFFAFAAVDAAHAQQPNPYFSLNSERTFLPGEKPVIRLYTHDVEMLEFRVYRVNDPEKFFSQLESVHSFGERHVDVKEQIEEKSWLERFHDWKRELWRAIRDFFRRQFSSTSRTVIRQKQAESQKTRVGQATLFAQVPVLNWQRVREHENQNEDGAGDHAGSVAQPLYRRTCVVGRGGENNR